MAEKPRRIPSPRIAVPLLGLALAAVAAIVIASPGSPPPAPRTACEPSTASRGVKLAATDSSRSVAAENGLAIGIDGGYGPWSRCEIRQRDTLGAAVTRHEWSTEEPVAAQDTLVETAANQAHTRIEALIGGNEIEDPTAFSEFVVAFIKRYGTGGAFWRAHPDLDEAKYAIRDFELLNEPYFAGVTAAEYADFVRPTLEAVRAAGLPAQILLASRVYGDDASWVETLYEKIPNLNSLFAGFADHPYDFGIAPAAGGPASSFGQIGTLREAMNAFGAGAKPIFITEYGESTAACGSECVDEITQAKRLKQMIEAVASNPGWKVAMLAIYQLIDRGTNNPERELEFGILKQSGQPKPAWSLVHEAAERYAGETE